MYRWKLSGLSILERLFINRPFLGSFKPIMLTTMKGEASNTKVKFPVNSRFFTMHENNRQVLAQRKSPLKTVTIYMQGDNDCVLPVGFGSQSKAYLLRNS